MGQETGSRSTFNSTPIYEIYLKITTYSIYEVCLLRMRVECPLNKFTGYPSKHTNLDTSCVYWCHYADAVVDKLLGGKCALCKQDLHNDVQEKQFH